MGNKSSSTSSESINPAVLTVKEAQRKYLEEIETKSESESDSDLEADPDSSCDDTDGIKLFRKRKFYSMLNTVDRKAKKVDPSDYTFPFENIVFEGGGNKGLAYCGAVRVLEELGIWPQIRRLAGASAGAMTATLLAVGYNSRDIEGFLSQDLSAVFLDHQCGYCSLLPNLMRGYGWNPGKKIFEWFGNQLEAKTQDKDITFKQVLQKYEKELCIVVTNLNQMSTEYCHPKTTPDMPVRQAVRMSMAIPGMFRAPRYKLHGVEDTFVDGGVLCNYPIHCYDGWWLSMKNTDSFIQRLQPLSALTRLFDRSERFGEFNNKTLGFLLYADNEEDVLRYQLEKRMGVELQDLPDTKLAREKVKTRQLQLKADREHRRVVRAVDAFLQVLKRHNVDCDATISRDELEAALRDETTFTRTRRRRIFGDVDNDTILQYLDRDGNGKITYNELMRFMEETGITLQTRFLGYDRKEVNNLFNFFSTLQSTLLTNVKRIYVEERDIERSVGINTGHVGTTDFVLEDADREFIVERGRRSVIAFLKYYVAINDPPLKRLATIEEGLVLRSQPPIQPTSTATVATVLDQDLPYIDVAIPGSKDSAGEVDISLEEKLPILNQAHGT
ncbi:uncharacterized protein [Haliotis asinina]|uniref:uncharacterized protein n=1 Tax=Haliotis asinina TaxID=109174 RepID=UPI003531EA3D